MFRYARAVSGLAGASAAVLYSQRKRRTGAARCYGMDYAAAGVGAAVAAAAAGYRCWSVYKNLVQPERFEWREKGAPARFCFGPAVQLKAHSS